MSNTAINNNTILGGSGISTLTTVAQLGHGLEVEDVIKVKSVAGDYEKAKASSLSEAEVVGIVTAKIDANHFTFITAGQTLEMTGKVPNSIYYLDPVTAGLLTLTEPVAVGQVSRPVLYTDTATSGFYLSYRGVEVGSGGGGGSLIGTQVFKITANYIKTPGTNSIIVQMIGGGGGTGGTGNLSSGGDGGTGGTTSFGTLCVAFGGTGSTHPQITWSTAGVGGLASSGTGDITLDGSPGLHSIYQSATENVWGGNGGVGLFGCGGGVAGKPGANGTNGGANSGGGAGGQGQEDPSGYGGVSGGGGGAFSMITTTDTSLQLVTIGAGGLGGTIGGAPHDSVGDIGGSGICIVYEYS